MLKKLIKYDLIWINKSMVVFFVISLLISCITRGISLVNDTFVGNILYIVFKSLTISCIVSIVINCAIRIWNRFRLNIYKDESYLTHTLPIKRNTLYKSKIISSFVSIIISLVFVLISFIIVFLDNKMIDKLKDIFSNNDVAFIFVLLLVLMVLEVLYMTYCGILGLIIGHRSNNNKMVKSVVFGLALYFMIQIVIFIIILSIGLLNPDMSSLFSNTINEDINFISAVKKLVLIVNITYIVFTTGLCISGKLLFKNGINIE